MTSLHIGLEVDLVLDVSGVLGVSTEDKVLEAHLGLNLVELHESVNLSHGRHDANESVLKHSGFRSGEHGGDGNNGINRSNILSKVIYYNYYILEDDEII